jgi:pimeloyl-ACP methyl ester carboxylesterase
VLLAPGCDLANRWRALIDEEQLRRWESRGWIEAKDGAGAPARLHWGFMEDARAQPPWPRPACPTLVLHGTRDAVVPLAVGQELVEGLPDGHLEVVDDDHDLRQTLPYLLDRALRWFGLEPSAASPSCSTRDSSPPYSSR